MIQVIKDVHHAVCDLSQLLSVDMYECSYSLQTRTTN